MYAREGWCVTAAQFTASEKPKGQEARESAESKNKAVNQSVENQNDWMETGRPFVVTEW